MSYSATEIRFTRLLALVRRNRNKLDPTDYEIYTDTEDWFYRRRNPKPGRPPLHPQRSHATPALEQGTAMKGSSHDTDS